MKHSPDKIEDFLQRENTKTAQYGMLVYVISEFSVELVLSITWLSSRHVEGQAIIIPKIFKLLLFMLINLVFCPIIAYKQVYSVKKAAEDNQETVEDNCNTKENLCKKRIECLHVLVFFLALLNFAYFILTTILPFVMLVFVHPMWASSFLLLITVIFVAAHISVHMYTSRRDSERCFTLSICIYYIIYIYTYIFILFILAVYFYIFELFIIYARGVASGGTVKTIIFQIIPSGLLTFVYWLINKLALHTEKKDAKEHSSHSFRNWLKNYIQGNKSDETDRLPSHQEIQESHTMAQQENQGPDEQQPTVQGGNDSKAQNEETVPLLITAQVHATRN